MFESESEPQARPETLETAPRSKDPVPSATADISPNELFKKVVLNDAKQNNRLSTKFGASSKRNMNNGLPANGQEPHSKGSTRMRFVVCTLGLMSLAMSQMSRMVINQTITEMVDPKFQAAKEEEKTGGLSAPTTDGSCPWPMEDISIGPADVMSATIVTSTLSDKTSTAAPSRPATSPTTTFHLLSVLNQTSPSLVPAPTTTDQTSTDEDGNMEEIPDFELILNEEEGPVGPPISNVTGQGEVIKSKHPYRGFEWTMKQQGVLLGGFYYSYFVFMILGGRLAEVYGAKYVILVAVLGSALINLATPWMAHNSFLLLVMSRVVMGAIQSGVFPAMYALIAKWLTMSEASIFAPLIKMNLRLGMVFASLIPGLVYGWPMAFYSTGIVSTIWSIAWIIVATSDPADNRWVSPGELAHINRKKRKARQFKAESESIEMTPTKQGKRAAPKRSLKTPWLKIWTSPSVIGLIVLKLTFNYALDFLAIELPSYLKYVHHASRQKVSMDQSLFATAYISGPRWIKKGEQS